MKIVEVTRYLEFLAPLALQEDYDNCGLLLGDPEEDLTGALLCLDVTVPVIEEAANRNCNLVIAHHPFIFRGLKKITAAQPESAVITRAIRSNIAVYAIHTNLDNSLDGLNAYLMNRLGVSNCRVLAPKEQILSKLAVFCPAGHAGQVREALFNAGAGRIGNYDSCSYNLQGEGTFRASEKANPFVGKINELHTERETRIEVIYPRYLENRIIEAMLSAHPYEEVAYDLYPLANRWAGAGAGLIGELPEPMDEIPFLEHVKRSLDIRVIRHSKLREKPVKRVALCSGSGGFLTGDAVRANACVFLTADLKYHDFSGFDESLLLADIGHYESETWVKEWLHAALIEKFPTFAILISEMGANPVNYF